MDRRLVELCEAIATADAEGERRYGAAASRADSAATRCRRGSPAARSIGITCLDADGDVPNRHLPTDTPGARSTPTRSSAPTASRSS